MRRPTEADAACPASWAYETCQEQEATSCSGRRGGKTRSNMRLSAATLAEPGTSVIYVSLVEKNAKEQFFLPLLDMLKDYGWRSHEERKNYGGQWDFTADRTSLIIRTKWGSELRGFSAHDMHTVSTVRGYPADLLILDEAQEPRDAVVRYLMEEVAPAFCIDRGGRLRVTGTVPIVAAGFFHELLDNPRVPSFTWTSFEHDYPRPREKKVEELEELCRLKGWPLELVVTGADSKGRPIYDCGPGTAIKVQTEFFARRIVDPESRLYEYDEERNGAEPPEGLDMYAFGMDFGWTDLATINVRGWRSDDPEMRTYQVAEWGDNQLPAWAPEGRPSIGAKLLELMEMYPPWVVIADDASGSDKITMATLSEMLGVELTPKPRSLEVSVELMNDGLRTGRVQVTKGSNAATEIASMRKIPNANKQGAWKYEIVASRRAVMNPDGTPGKLSHKDHASAARYAEWGCRAWWNSVTPPQERKSFFELTPEEQDDRRREVAMSKVASVFRGKM